MESFVKDITTILSLDTVKKSDRDVQSAELHFNFYFKDYIKS